MAIASSTQIAQEAVTSPWHGFKTGLWQKEIDVRDFIQQNYSPYALTASTAAAALRCGERQTVSAALMTSCSMRTRQSLSTVATATLNHRRNH